MNIQRETASTSAVKVGTDPASDPTGSEVDVAVQGLDAAAVLPGGREAPSEISGARPAEGGEGGEGGAGGPGPDDVAGAPRGSSDDLEVSNATFVAEIFRNLPDGAVAVVCSKPGNPEDGGWQALAVGDVNARCPAYRNNYINASSFHREADGAVRARKANFEACHALMLDDLGTKVPMDRLGDFKPSWVIETSPGNHQAGIILDPPLVAAEDAEQLLSAIIAAGLCDPGSAGPTGRWMRLPNAINGKPKHADASGDPFRCRPRVWRPDRRYSIEQVLAGLKLELPQASPSTAQRSDPFAEEQVDHAGDEVYIPTAAENPVLTALKSQGRYKAPLHDGKHDITCPWVEEHTDELDTGAAYFEPSEEFPVGGFKCMHSHGDKFHITQLLQALDVSLPDAQHKPVIRVLPGDMSRVVRAAEKQLAVGGQHYQHGGLIVSIATDPASGDSKIVPTSLPALTQDLSRIARWEKPDGRSKAPVACDPPHRHVAILYDAQHFDHLPVLAGLARQPYFREADGELITQPGYDCVAQRYGVFDPRQFHFPESTPEAARNALALLQDLIDEFHFVAPHDQSAALSGMLTASVRPSLAYAPAYHSHAPVFASGKTLLCDVIGAFAGPGPNLKVSYPTTSEEATKVLLSLLMTGPAVIEFDDMDSDWIPHGIIKRVLTAEKVTERILGLSKTATVSTRTLFLGSGNNVGPVRDLLRRVLTIHLDPRCATPATLRYRSNPVEKVRAARGHYVAAALTIILAWRKAGCPRPDAENIATFGGAWSDYCRYPLMWLGLPDPATALLQQVKHDPDGDALAGLMKEWIKVFGSNATTVRKVVEKAEGGKPDLLDALREFPVVERGEINRSKLGWVLKKNANRIVGGYEFQRSESDGRTAWCVVSTKAQQPRSGPPSPPSPPLTRPVDITSLDDDLPDTSSGGAA